MAGSHPQRGGQYLRHASWMLRSSSAGHRQDLPTTRAVLAGLAGLAAGPIAMLAAVGGTGRSAGRRQHMRLLHRTRCRHVEHPRATPQGQHGTQQTQQEALQRAHDAACMPQLVARVQRRGAARPRRPRSSSRHSASPGADHDARYRHACHARRLFAARQHRHAILTARPGHEDGACRDAAQNDLPCGHGPARFVCCDPVVRPGPEPDRVASSVAPPRAGGGLENLVLQ